MKAQHLEFRQRVRDQEACRITIIQCLDMLKPLREKLANALPDDPHGVRASWLGTAQKNLELLLKEIVENEL